MNGRLLTFNCHEAWVHQLRYLERPLDIIVNLPGRHTRGWDDAMRPLPPCTRLVTIEDVRGIRQAYDCIIAHNLTDLLDVKDLPGPRLLVIHLTLEGMVLEQHAQTPLEDFRSAVGRFVAKTRTHVVAISELKARSWGLTTDIVSSCADPAEYPAWQGDLARGLRVSNFVLRRARTLRWDFHQKAFSDLPVTLVGHNPEMPGVSASPDWAALKETFAHHRFFVHTADLQLEDGYNMATLEAMAAGLPVLGNRHPTSPIEHGVSGFLSDDPVELNGFARRLMADRALAEGMGRAAQRTVGERFSPAKFACSLSRSIARAQSLR